MRFAPLAVTLRQLQYVVAVAERGSFRRAAEDCHVAQPSLSAQVAAAEEALGVRIFERDKRGIAVTAGGAQLIARARKLLVELEDFANLASSLGDPLSGAFRLGVIPTIAPYLLPEVAPVLRSSFPKMSFVWTEERTSVLVKRIADGELDAAILAVEADIGDLAKCIIGKDAFVFVAAPAHRLSRSAGPVRAAELDGEAVLLLDDGHCFRDQALSFCARNGAREAVGYRATSLPTLVQMAAGGAGVTLLPRLALSVENRRGDLRVRQFAPKVPARTIALVWRKSNSREKTFKAIGSVLHSAYDELHSLTAQ